MKDSRWTNRRFAAKSLCLLFGNSGHGKINILPILRNGKSGRALGYFKSVLLCQENEERNISFAWLSSMHAHTQSSNPHRGHITWFWVWHSHLWFLKIPCDMGSFCLRHLTATVNQQMGKSYHSLSLSLSRTVPMCKSLLIFWEFLFGSIRVSVNLEVIIGFEVGTVEPYV